MRGTGHDDLLSCTVLVGPYFFRQESNKNLIFYSAQPLKMISSEIESMCEKVRKRDKGSERERKKRMSLLLSESRVRWKRF